MGNVWHSDDGIPNTSLWSFIPAHIKQRTALLQIRIKQSVNHYSSSSLVHQTTTKTPPPPPNNNMCTFGFSKMECGCKVPIDGTGKQCNYAKSRGKYTYCEEFMWVENRAKSKSSPYLCAQHFR
ncbi:unnamed protein product [Sordaria macrospora k-hell]|uniref:WGS project CABT00000000 data, contig 2.9 n=1 Tax=Sordaria macrospora (strain ATCC MYA-333 / DSM 997 / K(L3346) / K-hell) TaxID=771870 RepID=F7VVK4_SORMK|nr:uncharacterized protein SMAC_03577 [Sordaria macrospora k-hell]CCC09545.1 unnamed protein product [Sordaria macrospora k-hell]